MPLQTFILLLFSGCDIVPVGLAREAQGDLEDAASVGSGLQL